jgi:hypothetical protein
MQQIIFWNIYGIRLGEMLCWISISNWLFPFLLDINLFPLLNIRIPCEYFRVTLAFHMHVTGDRIMPVTVSIWYMDRTEKLLVLDHLHLISSCCVSVWCWVICKSCKQCSICIVRGAGTMMSRTCFASLSEIIGWGTLSLVNIHVAKVVPGTYVSCQKENVAPSAIFQ